MQDPAAAIPEKKSTECIEKDNRGRKLPEVVAFETKDRKKGRWRIKMKEQKVYVAIVNIITEKNIF